jgi:hypothetical protein
MHECGLERFLLADGLCVVFLDLLVLFALDLLFFQESVKMLVDFQKLFLKFGYIIFGMRVHLI